MIANLVNLVGQKLTFTVIKCDVGSPGGHTKPSDAMLAKVKEIMTACNWVIDLMITHTGDDTAIIISHLQGINSSDVHKACRGAFEAAAEIAKEEGLYGAGQDLYPTAPSGNVRGTGPGVAELSFKMLPKHRPAEAITIIAADKCAPGAFSPVLFAAFADPSRTSGFLLSPDVSQGYTFVIEDMSHKANLDNPTHRQIRLNSPEQNLQILVLLRQVDRYGVAAIYSRAYPDEIAVAVSTDRLHNITGKYQGKDDPVMILRTQGIFPALEEVIDPFRMTMLVTGDARGSHIMPLMPVPIDTAVAGAYCLPDR